jgi:hypothetical protein
VLRGACMCRWALLTLMCLLAAAQDSSCFRDRDSTNNAALSCAACCMHVQVGFADPRVLEVEPIAVHDTGLKALLGDADFYSITFRCVAGCWLLLHCV